ncbi:MAG: caspase family protein, partial [bacterium]
MPSTSLNSAKIDLMMVLVFCACIMSSGPAMPARHALLVGVGDYPQSALDLLGPENDISALEKILKENWNFRPDRIRVLMNEQATKAEVLKELRALKQRSQPGDQLFFYFSGHGTSARDEAVRLPLPDMTAGLLPYDAKLNLAKHEIVASLIVGRTDLRPIFQDIDGSGRQLLVMIDACYSGNAVRGFSLPGEKMRSRFV